MKPKRGPFLFAYAATDEGSASSLVARARPGIIRAHRGRKLASKGIEPTAASVGSVGSVGKH